MTGGWSTDFLAALASIEDRLEFFPTPLATAGRTVRQRVRLRRGGQAVRLVLSNQFGRGPLVIEAVTVTVGEDFASAAPALRDSARRWEIPAGATAVSDPVPLAVGANAELTIDCFLAAETETEAGASPGAGDWLFSAQRTGEVAPGDQAGRPELAGAEPFPSLYWITQVHTDRPAAGRVIVALGDSITRGDGTMIDLDQRYPDHLQRRLLAAGLDDAVALNAGISGNRLLRSRIGPSMTERFDRDVLGVADATHVLILAGTNDIALPALIGDGRPTAGELVDGLLALARRAAAAGVQPALGTIPPFGGAMMDAFLIDGNEDIRRAANDAIRDQTDWPTLDFAAALADPADSGRLAAAFDSGDGVHPGDAGARAMADAVDLTLFK